MLWMFWQLGTILAFQTDTNSSTFVNSPEARRLTFYNVQVPGKCVEKVQGILKCGSEPQPKLISQWKLSKLYLWSFQIHYTSQRGIKVISFRLLCISCTFCNIISENLHWERTLCKMDSRIYQIIFFFQPT